MNDKKKKLQHGLIGGCGPKPSERPSTETKDEKISTAEVLPTRATRGSADDQMYADSFIGNMVKTQEEISDNSPNPTTELDFKYEIQVLKSSTGDDEIFTNTNVSDQNIDKDDSVYEVIELLNYKDIKTSYDPSIQNTMANIRATIFTRGPSGP